MRDPTEPLRRDDRGRPRLQPLVRARVSSLGPAGEQWHAGLGGRLGELAERWGLRWVRALPGGSASYVVAAQTRSGEPRVVKVRLPDPTLADEARVLRAAAGHGYVRLHGQDPDGDALLLEEGGQSMAVGSLPVEGQLAGLVDTLLLAWEAEPEPLPGDLSGEEDKAESLARLVRETDARLGRPTDPAVLRAALDHAQALAGWNGRRVTVHGDAHPGNTLRAPDGRGSGWLLVDPDGFTADPAYDVGVALRDWSAHLRGPDARDRLRGWCAAAADRAGLDRERVWAWAFLERVSTGLYVSGFGASGVGRPFLESARALLGR